MTPLAYYNEHDPFAAAWLRNLIDAGHIAPGVVDTRDIQRIEPYELEDYAQVHLFAGIGGWSLALRLAGWPDERRVWTGSCPCQPFSDAGEQQGFKDPRHLWPDMRRLVTPNKPTAVFGEQVASKLGREWLTGVRTDLEALGYDFGAADLCAAGVGAPHIRQRLFWVAHATAGGFGIDGGAQGYAGHADERGTAGRLADAERQRPGVRVAGVEGQAGLGWDRPAIDGATGGVGYAVVTGLEGFAGHGDDGHQPGRLDTAAVGSTAAASPTRGLADAAGIVGERREHEPQRRPEGRVADRGIGAGAFWSAFDLLPCRDGKARRVEPGSFPLAHGVPGRMGLLRGYGNAIVPQVAAAFIRAAMESGVAA